MKTIKNNLIMLRYVIRFCPFYGISAVLFIIASSLLSLSEVMVIQKVTELVIRKVQFSNILWTLLLFVLILLLCLFIQRLHQVYLQPRYRHVWVKKIQRIMFEKASALDISCFDNPKTYDSFSRALKEGDLKGIDTFDNFVYFLSSVFSVLTIGTYIIFQDPFLILLVLVESFISAIINSKSNRMWYKTEKENEKEWRKLDYTKRVFYMAKYTCDIKTTNLSKLLIEKQNDTKVALDQGYRKTENRNFFYWAIEDVFYQVTRNLGGYAYLMWKVYKDQLSIGAFASTVAAVHKFRGLLYGVVGNFVALRVNALYIDDFLWLMNYKPEIEGKGGTPIRSDHPVIQLENVSFNYPGQDVHALKDVNLEIRPKEKIAIIGYNGAGKTTLIKLLLKLYHPTDGRIVIDGENYCEADEKVLRQHFSSIFQNFQIYSVSVLENILFRKRLNVDDDQRCWDALDKAGLGDKIRESKHGLDTILTKEFDNDGLMLSGGEKQKLALARIFASQSPIIILDEPTSALDPVSEYEVNKKILTLCEDKTIIMISHRLSTIVDAAKIYMFINGQIVEQGNHHELMIKKGKYFEMFETQAKLYRV